MKVGYEVKIEGEIWECILGGSNTAVFQKKIKLQKKIPSPIYIPKNKREDVYYLEFIKIDDVQQIRQYLKDNGIKNKNIYVHYILITYCNLRCVDIANEFGVSKSSVSKAKRYIEDNGLKDAADDLARSIGYWKYKQLNELNGSKN